MNTQFTTNPVARIIPFRHAFQCLRVKFDNRYKYGKYPFQSYEAYAVIFPGGHVVLDSEDAPRKGYESRGEMERELGKYGKVEVEELGEVDV